MTITEKRAAAPVATYPTPVRPGDDRFVPLATEVRAVAAAHADEHDRDATFVSEAYDTMRANGYLRLAVPEELGGSDWPVAEHGRRSCRGGRRRREARRLPGQRPQGVLQPVAGDRVTGCARYGARR